jgi:GAF domain-containing protein
MNSDELLERYFGLLPGGRLGLAVRSALEAAVATIGAEEGSLLAHDEAADDLCFVMTVGNPESERTLLAQRVPLGQGITGLAAAKGEVQVGAPVYRDVKQSERLSDGPESVLAAPLLVGEELLGVITAVTFVDGRRFGAREAELFERTAQVIAALIETAAASSGGAAVPAAYGAASRREEAVLERLRQVLRRDPAALEAVESLVAAIERLVAVGHL